MIRWLWIGLTCQAVGFIAAVLLTNGDTTAGNRTIYIIDEWIVRTVFWFGVISVAGYVLDRLFGSERS